MSRPIKLKEGEKVKPMHLRDFLKFQQKWREIELKQKENTEEKR